MNLIGKGKTLQMFFMFGNIIDGSCHKFQDTFGWYWVFLCSFHKENILHIAKLIITDYNRITPVTTAIHDQL